MSASKRPMRPGDSSDGPVVPNGTGRKKFGKGDRSRRVWTPREEEILVASLLDLVEGGWKSDNGFRSGFLQKIEDNIRSEFPKSDIKATPHVVSKITAMKKSYGSLRLILDRSGVGFNVNGDFKIDIDDDQWAQVVAADSKAKDMRYKSWPHWEAWKVIFGKDRATGTGREFVDAAASTMRAQMASGSHHHENDYYPTFEDFIPDEIPPDLTQETEKQGSSEGQSAQQPSTTKTGGQKRKVSPTDDGLMAFLDNLHDKTNSRLDIIASRIGYEFDMGKARQEVYNKLGTVDGLTTQERYELCNILGDKPQRLEVFMGMPANAKLGYVQMLIQEKHSGV